MNNPIIDQAISARYEDSSYSTVLVEWKGQDGKIRIHSIPADPSNTDYQDLVASGYTEEILVRTTEAYKRQASRDINVLIQKAAQELADKTIEIKLKEKVDELNKRLQAAGARELEAETKSAEIQKSLDTGVWEMISKSDDNKDELFKFKLWALEQEAVKNASSDAKKELRKQESLFKAISCYTSLL
jgi:hypothetical protein